MSTIGLKQLTGSKHHSTTIPSQRDSSVNTKQSEWFEKIKGLPSHNYDKAKCHHKILNNRTVQQIKGRFFLSK